MAEDPISSFCNTLAAFCNHLHSSSDALKQSIDRRPIPLDSASSIFTQCLNRRVSAATADLDMLDSMSFGTVSFEELLGHCNELYKKNHSDLLQLQEHLQSRGYTTVPDIEEEDEFEDIQYQDPEDKLDSPSSFYGSLSAADPSFKSFEEDALLQEFRQEDQPVVSSEGSKFLPIGPKTRSYLLLLVRMNRLVVETIDGILSYRVL
ncbi:hypothetical protein VIGAN_04402200 [Vigna angularis var. angularis]|uniref:Uncharacterized protein n=1 Tax=Vigna angularis var. angularis TaxID=157739 RepID=A0A0S3S0M5_PHAAN|nr:hypothetical protein VIGAN_04402200 [Vigna angularis var. angularis]